jgi:exocyst complex component 4
LIISTINLFSKVRTLIQDYVTDEQRGLVSGRNPISSISEVLRDGKFSRDKGKVRNFASCMLILSLTENNQSVFRFTDTDLKRISKNLKPHEEGLTKVLKETMPGLVHSNTSDNLRDSLASSTTATGPSASASNLTLPTDDRMLTGMDQHHRLLIKPDTFNVTVLFQPTLAFLDRVVDVLPAGIDSAKASSGVLDDFVLKVYLPQLEEKVLDLFHAAVAGMLRTSVFSVIRRPRFP